MDWQVSSVLHSQFVFVGIRIGLGIFGTDYTPVLVLELGLRGGAQFGELVLVGLFEVLSEAGEGFDVILLLFFLEGLHYKLRSI